MNIQLAPPFSPSVKSLSYMLSIDVFVPCLVILEEAQPIRIEVLRRVKNDSVSAESY